MTRVALYARFSDPKQSARSIADQIAVCVAHAAQRGWDVVATFSDAAISGASMANRPGLLAALAAAERGEFEILLTEAEDRISRNLGHLAVFRDDLATARVTLATLHTDNVDTMHVAFKGMMAEQYLVDLGHKTRRGMHSNAEKGLATGSRLYGYATQPGGATTIVEAEAEIVRRICTLFADYALSGREIANALNLDRIPGPRGGFWNASSIHGSAQRGNGILHTELYAGVKTWNRTEVRKDPRTGKRTPTTRPPEEWKRVPVEPLRIVPQDLWERVQARQAHAATLTRSVKVNQRKPGVFSGLLKCGQCGSSYTSLRRGKLVCAGNRERGSSVCSNTKLVDRAQVEARALEGLQARMLSPAAVSTYVRAYHAAWAKLEAAAANRMRPLVRRAGEIERTIERLVDAICDGQAAGPIKDRLAALEVEREQVAAELAGLEAERQPVTLHPGAAEAYARKVEILQGVLTEIAADADFAAANRKLIDAVRGLIDRIEIVPNPRGLGGVDLRLHGNLAVLMAPTNEGPGVSAGASVTRTANHGAPSRGLLVAGGRYSQAPTAIPAVFSVALYGEAA